jgi:hypothetical protein
MVSLPCPQTRASRLPLIAAQSSKPGSVSRMGSAQTRGSAIRKRRIRKAPSRIPQQVAAVSPQTNRTDGAQVPWLLDAR